MPTAQHVLDRRPRPVVQIGSEASVVEAARLMNNEHIGALVVVDDGVLVGIVTERDVMRRVVAVQRDPAHTPVGDIMSVPVACAAPGTTTTEMGSVMRERRIRHLPVVDENRIVGMISIGDLNRAEHAEQAQTIQYLSLYMSV